MLFLFIKIKTKVCNNIADNNIRVKVENGFERRKKRIGKINATKSFCKKAGDRKSKKRSFMGGCG
jgi:hypothetical protein